MAEMMKLTCPNCGKELEIPGELDEFSCLYCGTRSSVAELANSKAETPENFEERLADVQARLPGTVTRYPNHYKKLEKKDFFVTFEAYEVDNRELLKELDALAVVHPEGMEACIEKVCEDFLDALEKHMLGDKRWKHRSKQSQVIFEIKVVLAIFLTPLVRKMKLSMAESFRKRLHTSWKVRYPKENWEPGDYDVLAGGYKKRKLCYITTATCQSEGKPDDCPELMAFRAFRDGWLTEQGGEELIARYYDMAPAIVACIDLCDDSEKCYEEIRQRWLAPCYEALRQGRMEDCREEYISMVRTLEHRYLS